MLTIKEKNCLTEYANCCLRDIADQDYISARILYRLGLPMQFLWQAGQCIEKYMKAILLYNEIPISSFDHDLRSLEKEVLSIPDLPIRLPLLIPHCIEKFADEYNNRYFVFPYVMEILSLINLDGIVWHLRRYCIEMRLDVEKGKTVRCSPAKKLSQILNTYYDDHPNKYKIPGGFLESVLERNISSERKQERISLKSALVWQNGFYGCYHRKKMTSYKARAAAGTPPHYRHNCISTIRKYVKIPKEVVHYLSPRSRSRTP